MWFGFMVVLGTNGVLNLKTADSTIGACLLLWALLGFWKILEAPWLHTVGGRAGIITGLLAMYGSSAVLINGEMGRSVLPPRLSHGRTSRSPARRAADREK